MLPPAKRARVEDEEESPAGGAISTHVARSSQLAAPTMLFSGHQAAVYTCKFDPTGQYMASGSHDKSIFRECARCFLAPRSLAAAANRPLPARSPPINPTRSPPPLPPLPPPPLRSFAESPRPVPRSSVEGVRRGGLQL